MRRRYQKTVPEHAIRFTDGAASATFSVVARERLEISGTV